MSGPEFWSEVLQWVFLVVLTIMTTGLVYMVGDLSRRMGPEPGPLVPVDGVEIGTPAPELIGTEPRHGLTVQLSQYLGRPVVLAFLSPSCSPCVQLIGHLNREAGNRTDITFVVVAQPGNGVNYAQELSRQVIVIEDPDYSISKAFEVQRTPLVYVLDPEGRVAHRTIPNDFLELEDTIAGLGRPQGNARWVADTAGADGSVDTGRDIDK